MRDAITTTSAFAALFISTGALAQVEFESPERLTANGNDFSSVIYPSPVLHDIDGDDARDLVIGDLQGNLRFCQPGDTADPLAWGAMKTLQTAGGEPIRLHNW